jgi:hypothetical protein
MMGWSACWCSQDAGASLLFPPVHPEALAAALEVQEVVDHSPRLYGLQRGNWRLSDLRQVVALLRPLSLPGVCRLLRRLQVVSKRGRASVHSPDLAYDEKLAVIAQARQRCQADPERFPFLLTIDFSSVRQISCICTQLNRASCSATSFTLLLSVFVESRFNCNSISRRVCQWRFAI